MKKTFAFLLAVLFGCGALSFAAQGLRRYDVSVQAYDALSEAVHAGEEEGDCSVIVKTDGTNPDFRLLHPTYTVQGPDDVYVLCFDSRSRMRSAIDAAQAIPGVQYAEENGVVTAQGEYPYEGKPSYMTYAAEKIGYGDMTVQLLCRDTLADVTVAVVDSGIEANLPVFEDRLTEGKSFVRIDDGAEPTDDNLSPYTVDYFDHGTGVASIVADCTQKLPVWILPIKVLGDDGGGSFVDVAAGIRYAADQGADIINLSIAAKSCSQLLHEAVDYALEQNSLPVVAAGNYSINMETKDCCPAHLAQAVVVSGCDAEDNVYKKTCYGPTIDLCAPAVDVPCMKTDGRRGKADGTSFATPHVSAVAAMLQMYMPDAGCDVLTSLLVQNVRDIGDPGFDVKTGWGMPDLHALNGTLTPDPDHFVIGMQIETLPAKTTYYYKESFDPRGFSARILYADGTSEVRTDGFRFSGADDLKRGTQTVFATWGGQRVSFTVEVSLRWWQYIIWYCLFGFLWY